MKKVIVDSVGGLHTSHSASAFGIADKMMHQTITKSKLVLMNETKVRFINVSGFGRDSWIRFPRSRTNSVLDGTSDQSDVHNSLIHLPNFDVKVDSDPDGTPVIYIITPPHQLPTYRVKHMVSENPTVKKDKKHQDPDDDGSAPPLKFLKPPYDDNLIISALQASDEALLNEYHVKKLKYRDERGYNVKQFNDIHLLVCLFFYIYVNKLYASSEFYSGQRGHFHEFCSSHVSNGIHLGSKSYFTRCINKLVNKRYSFDEYIRAEIKPNVCTEKGDFNFVFWYEIYKKALECFERVIPPPII